MLLSKLGRRVATWVDRVDPFTEIYGVGRSILAFATMLTLVFTRTDVLFRPAAGIQQVPACMGIRSAGAYCFAGPNHLGAVQWLSVLGLLVVASGWRPRYTGVLHFWIAFSFQANAMLIEGGDQVSAILALLLVPVTLLDDRRWHWLPRAPHVPDALERRRRLIAQACFTLIRIQVAGIYFHASIAKFAVAEWTDGTVLYYWLNHPTFGAPAWLSPLLQPILLNAFAVAFLTWSVLVLEWVLSAGLIIDPRYKPALLVGGILLHTGIAVMHGLVTFAITMFAALILYLRPLDKPFGAGRLFERLRAALIARVSRRTQPPIAASTR